MLFLKLIHIEAASAGLSYLSVTILASQARTQLGLAPAIGIAKNPKFIQPSQALHHVSLSVCYESTATTTHTAPCNYREAAPDNLAGGGASALHQKANRLLAHASSWGARARPYGVSGS
jgi:hypothetical protein